MRPRPTEQEASGDLLEDPTPWPDAVEGAELLDELAATVSRYAVLPEYGAEIVALWILFAHAHGAFSISPLLALTSPTMRAGKSTMLELLLHLVPRPLPASNISPAALFRSVEKWRPTLLIDEGDSFLSLDHQYINLLNGSHKEAFAFVIRCEGDNHDPRRFVTWCPKVIAQIGHLPPTLHDRAIEIRLRRKLPEEKVERLRHDRAAQTLIPLQRQAWSWAQAHQLALTACDPDIPASLDDRAQDNWRVLIKIAEVAGGKWPEMIQTAALQFGANPEDGERSIAILLLEDLFGLFEDAPDIDFGSGQTERRLTTAQILGELNELEDQPWQSFKHGRPLNGQELATILRPFDIRPTVLWFNNIGGSMRGYRESDFVDVFKRYLGKELDR